MSIIIVDSIPFCHTDGPVGLTLGLFQYLPAILGLSSLWWGWRSGETLFVLYGYFFRFITISVLILQTIFEDPLARPECIFDPYDVLPRFGTPCWETSQAFGLFGFILAYHIVFKRQLGFIQVINFVLLMIVPLAMITTGSHYPHQIFIGCAYGLFASILYILAVKMVFMTFLRGYVKFRSVPPNNCYIIEYEPKRDWYPKYANFCYYRKDYIIDCLIGHYTNML